MAEIKNEFNVKPEILFQGDGVKYFAILFLLLFVVGCSSYENINEPTISVTSYFEAWNQKDYATMYKVISDGFKSLEPTASTFDQFKKYAESQGVEKVRIISITQKSNDGNQATVDYNVEFIVRDKRVPFKGTFTLKNKPNDSIPGWKLIHPYGEYIDIS